MSTILDLIERQGFDCAGTCAASELRVHEEVRENCAADKCHVYNKSWACPPACGDIYDYEKQMHSYEHCTVVQTVGHLEDDFDAETMMEASEIQQERVHALADAIDEAGLSGEVMLLSARTPMSRAGSQTSGSFRWRLLACSYPRCANRRGSPITTVRSPSPIRAACSITNIVRRYALRFRQRWGKRRAYLPLAP